MTTLTRRHRYGWPLARFEDTFSRMLDRFFEPTMWWGDGEWMPAVDITERDEAVVVRAEVPGMKSEDIEVSVHGNALTISGEKKEHLEDKGETYYRSERRYGAFRREIPLSAPVDPEKIEATCHDGVLTVTLPKSEKAKSRKIKVKAT